METPFIFGHIAENQCFIGYKDETEALVSSFISSKNVVVAGTRKCGKSSLLKKAADMAISRCQELRICRISLSNVRDEHTFFTILAQEVTKELSSTWEEAAAIIKGYFSGMKVHMSMDTGNLSDMNLTFERQDTASSPEIFWNMAESLAKEKKVRIAVIIDDLSNILTFKDNEAFLEKIFNNWDKKDKVSYCLAGNHRTLLLEWCSSQAARDAGYDNIIYLDRIEADKLIKYISSEFTKTAKYIDEETCNLIIKFSDSHPYYLQQLAQLSWLRTYVVCTSDIVVDAYNSLLNQLDMHFGQLTDSLTQQQLCYLKAILSGESVVSKADILYKYGISSATSATRSKQALIQRDIIDVSSGKVVLLDPLYGQWLKQRYFI